MDDLDYAELGFRCGIEIHQQLDAEHKLFCQCSTNPGNEQRITQVSRELRPVASELGAVDQAAQYEYLKDRRFLYNVYDDTSCLVELDEEPPHPVNQIALETGLEAAKLMHCTVPDEIHFMRKTVIDGSNTAGFQRTAIIGLDGYIETSAGKVAIEDIELEEESAGIHERTKEKGVFDLDRLGIPLIEIGTDASITSPAHAQEVAETLGMLLRSTGKVKRGLGTIRQDVNVSIEDGARVEVKGFQELGLMEDLVRNEVLRQQSLVQLMQELDGPVASDITEVTEIFAASDNEIITRIVESDGVVLAFTLAGLEGKMAQELCPGLHLGRELADYAKAQGVAGIMHSDEDLSRYGLEDEFTAVADQVDKTDGDVLVIVAEQDTRARNAAEAVITRANLLPEEVPEETRTAQETVTRYARPLPGKARMYPETDIPPLVIDEERLDRIAVPETLNEKEERLQADIGEELASQIVSSTHLSLFETLSDTYDARTVAATLLNTYPQLKDAGVPAEQLGERHWAAIFRHLEEDLPKGMVGEAGAAMAEHPEKDPEAIIDDLLSQTAGDEEIRSAVHAVLEEKRDLIEEQGEHAKGALMGLVMQRLDGADGAAVNRILEKELKDRL